MGGWVWVGVGWGLGFGGLITGLSNVCLGRRLDPKTMRIYHIDYDAPDDPDIQKRLKRVRATGLRVFGVWVWVIVRV